jgi:hypothetical protein
MSVMQSSHPPYTTMLSREVSTQFCGLWYLHNIVQKRTNDMWVYVISLMMVCNAYTHAWPTQNSIFCSWTYSIHNVGFSLCRQWYFHRALIPPGSLPYVKPTPSFSQWSPYWALNRHPVCSCAEIYVLQPAQEHDFDLGNGCSKMKSDN